MIWADRVVAFMLASFTLLMLFFAVHGDMETPVLASFFSAIAYAIFVYGLPVWLFLRAIDAISSGQLFRWRSRRY